MAHLLPVALTVLLCAACSPAPAEGSSEPNYPELISRVVDQAGLLPPADERQLAEASERLEREVGPQFVIVTVPSLQGRPIEEYGVGLGRHWGIGHKGTDDGLLLIVAPNERKVRIEVGYGLEKRVSDHFAKQVIEEDILPAFSQGRFPTGIEAGSKALIERLRSGEVDQYAWEKKAA